ncbi:MAG: zinc-binding dehydrogenase [Alphaproteobacteria bacterium]
MKAVRIHAHGGVEQLRYEEAPEPQITAPTDVIVKLKNAALNHVDIWNRLGEAAIPIPLPHILGADGAGIVVEVGSETTTVKPGDAVCLYAFTGCGQCEFCLTGRDFMCIHVVALGQRLEGTYAEYVKLPVENCFPIPAGLSFAEAAAFPLVFITVWRMLMTNAKLTPGETMLILGIGGGVASAALQIAKRIGVRVIVTSGSDEKIAQARSYGADHGINYRRADFARETIAFSGGRGVDVVLDCVAGENWQKSLAVLTQGGRLVTCGATAGGLADTDLSLIFTKHLQIFGSTLGSREEFRQVIQFINTAQIRPIIDRIFPLAEAAAAQRRMEEGKQFGKIVLDCSQ